jgi:AraC family transcriptional regulator
VLAATQITSEPDRVAYDVTEQFYPIGSKRKLETEGNAYFCYVLDGSLAETTAGRSVAYPTGKLLYFPIHHECVLDFEQPARCLIIRIGQMLLGRFSAEAQELGEIVSIQDWEATWLVKRLQKEFVMRNPARELAIEAIILQLLALAARTRPDKLATRESFWLKKVRAFLDTQYLRDYRLSELATLAGVHRVHLVREFRKHYGVTIGQHIRRLRVEHACELLACTDLLLRDIATACRFVDQSHFSKQFKKISGFTPAEYRNLVKTA